MKIRNRAFTKLAAALAVALIRLLFVTCRREIRLAVPETCPYFDTGAQRFLYCIWHDHAIVTIFAGKPQKMAGLVSPHQDGSYLADAMQMVNVTPVRGSTNRNNVRALRQLMDVTEDFHVAITPDGPRGPRRRLKAGLLFLASRTGRPIVPVAYSCTRCWRIKGRWTDMLIPKPFSKVFVLCGSPVSLPLRLRREELQAQQALLQEEMERLDTIAARMAAGLPPDAEELRAAA